jgi:predicted metal-dependent hydrolase
VELCLNFLLYSLKYSKQPFTMQSQARTLWWRQTLEKRVARANRSCWMPKRWGSWNQRGVIYLNPELVLALASCIDYVITHELCHLVHAPHGRELYDLLRRVMPDWEERKDRLERDAAETSGDWRACGARSR